ncbi:MAG: hypothetical protein IT374_01975 [Polyangiaceae bacterium]|nr:hypothetical protein [Polyangiaceae bacterium]
MSLRALAAAALALSMSGCCCGRPSTRLSPCRTRSTSTTTYDAAATAACRGSSTATCRSCCLARGANVAVPSRSSCSCLRRTP